MNSETKKDMLKKAAEAAQFLKLFAHEGRLKILCFLSDNEMSVSELQEATEVSQSQLSQFLKQFELSGIVSSRKEGKWVKYSLASGQTKELIESLQNIFCKNGDQHANS